MANPIARWRKRRALLWEADALEAKAAELRRKISVMPWVRQGGWLVRAPGLNMTRKFLLRRAKALREEAKGGRRDG